MNYIDVTSSTHTSLDVLLENILKITGTSMKIENCQMHGQASQDLFFEWKATWRIYMVRCGDWRGNKQHIDVIMHGHRCGYICLMHNANKYVVSSSLNLRMRISRTSWKNAHRKLELPMPAAMLCKTPINSGGETLCGIGESKTKHACIVDADECMRIQLEGVPYRYHEDHIAAKTNKFTQSLWSGAQVYANASSIKNTGCEGCNENKMGKIGKDGSWRK